MKRVVLESPFAGNIAANVQFARACVRDCLKKGDAPIASHLLYTQPGILADEIPDERVIGIAAGHEWIAVADALVVYTDMGISPGMEKGIAEAKRLNVPVVYRRLVPL